MNDTRGRKAWRKASDIEHHVFVSLEDLLVGCHKKMKIQRRKLVRPVSTSGRGPAHSTTEERLLSFDIPAGTKIGTKIRFTEEGNQLPGQIPADVVFVVQDQPHPLFLREGNHLHTQVTIGLRLALLGGEVKASTILNGSLSEPL
ncbi:unnamed protein product [Schistocephalus solidus]|uniref:DnaJ_C domain-containing protein n=1 Tax=Schistocephalus solidus TaxID=70667 RepID=A0A183SEM1_SCHSO|nr:unnamed protein product [Schistocephalus solidus]